MSKLIQQGMARAYGMQKTGLLGGWTLIYLKKEFWAKKSAIKDLDIKIDVSIVF